jgi:hypothetical protein
MVRSKEARRSKSSKQVKKRICKRSRGSKSKEENNMTSLASALGWILNTKAIFANDTFHGNINWSPLVLVFQALCWAFQESRNVTDAFSRAIDFCDCLGMKETAKTYPRFINALARYSCLATRLRARIQECAQEIGGRFWRDDSWCLFAFDGSRVSAPRTVSNERAFCATNYGKGTTAKYRKKKTKGMRRTKNEKKTPEPPRPQIWITSIWHMGLRLTWTWRLGKSNASERGHVQEILENEIFPTNSLFCGDAGFVGYPLWHSIKEATADFLVRVGANVSLLSECADIERLSDHIVLCWPKGQMNSGAKPLRLRLVRVKIGKTTMWMLTSVLDRRKLSIKKIIRYYKMRWGIEVQFRGLKQTLDKHNLRCRNSDNALAELEWSILGMVVVEILALKQQIEKKGNQRKTYNPIDRSLAKSVRALRECMAKPQVVLGKATGLVGNLSNATVQKYRNKTDKRSRYRPSNPDKKPLGDPQLTKLTADHRRKIAIIERRIAA